MSRLVLGVLLVCAPRVADACGGCFAPPEEVTSVDGHRMVIALNPQRTILWDQITYSGNPADFVWVLPVPSTEVTIEIAESAFFDELDEETTPIIRPRSAPPSVCTSAACGGSEGAGPAPLAPVDGVTVHDRTTVGPYDTVVLTGDSGGALYEWLEVNGYAVPDATLPAIQHYVDKHSAFLVLRLAPWQGMNAMQPVRVEFPGYMGTFPLKMVTVGAVGQIELSLWVVSDSRYAAHNYPTVTIAGADLSWDWSAGRSDYPDVFDAKIEAAGGRAWIAEYAGLADELAVSGRDWDVARGIAPWAYVTRLRTRMLVDHLDADLELAPSADPGPIARELFAERDVNRPEDSCTGGTSTSTTLPPLLFGLLAIVATRLRPTPSPAGRSPRASGTSSSRAP
jgi:hypothetical protein